MLGNDDKKREHISADCMSDMFVMLIGLTLVSRIRAHIGWCMHDVLLRVLEEEEEDRY